MYCRPGSNVGYFLLCLISYLQALKTCCNQLFTMENHLVCFGKNCFLKSKWKVHVSYSCTLIFTNIYKNAAKSDNGFAWISAQPLLEPLLNMQHPTSYILHPAASYMELPHTKGHTSNPWNRCPKRGLLTTGGQIPIEKHYHSFPYNLQNFDFITNQHDWLTVIDF